MSKSRVSCPDENALPVARGKPKPWHRIHQLPRGLHLCMAVAAASEEVQRDPSRAQTFPDDGEEGTEALCNVTIASPQKTDNLHMWVYRIAVCSTGR